MEKSEITKINSTYNTIKQILEKARTNAYRAVNFIMVQAYWQIGKAIVEEEQKGKERADYGKQLIRELALKLNTEYGEGFTETNLKYMRQFYVLFPKSHALRDKLTWTHYRLLLKVERDDARNFYMIESINNNWSTREIERQINTLLFERVILSKDKKKVKEISKKGQIMQKPQDIIKDPYVLEFLRLDDNTKLVEKDLENALIDKLQKFLLELGKGFSFIARQKRITLDGDHFYIDLVFYNYILKCFFLIDLKVGKLTHNDIGQMDFYVRYFEKEIKKSEDNTTIGLILCADKNNAMARYTLLADKKNIFASKYKLYLPSEEELKKELVTEKQRIDMENKLKE